ncbi:unnamed protein product [Pleuronectes platessa]|uniref:Secreted protein n=1 Tax=Pleuronectes platessa TaxID=8262 RepID=A0A9N7YXT4_PLEPL|nr:unnamed protein product [Pleuronectes platessa]
MVRLSERSTTLFWKFVILVRLALGDEITARPPCDPGTMPPTSNVDALVQISPLGRLSSWRPRGGERAPSMDTPRNKDGRQDFSTEATAQTLAQGAHHGSVRIRRILAPLVSSERKRR